MSEARVRKRRKCLQVPRKAHARGNDRDGRPQVYQAKEQGGGRAGHGVSLLPALDLLSRGVYSRGVYEHSRQQAHIFDWNQEMASADVKEEPLIAIKVDASAEGCSGMFWRTKPVISATSSSGDWPRNGTVLMGRHSKEHAGWVQFENGYWLPEKQAGFQILFDVATK